ncbi:MAG: tRNA-(ms[2]io[6]A)-hydroxylase [Gammaproteobacteria bacterium]|nr:tRNA-(ms[2]io[6]A)-hydroxylase [Gammaproteobacteria bacterium]
MSIDLSPVLAFLACRTPLSWCEQAVISQDILLLDHAHCEKKAASTAITLLFRYPEYEDLVYKLSRLAREELRHFEQVITLLKKRHIPFRHLPPSRYAAQLHKLVSTHEPARLVDVLIMCAFIEARSCERFASLLPYLDAELAEFYGGLLASEARHFELYLKFARAYAKFDISERIAAFRQREKELIESPDSVLRFHSGVPESAEVVSV